MRTNNAIKNTLASILVEIVAALSGIILPRYFISVYGSSVNGLVISIGQYITYMGLVEAGVSAAATVELYKPLAINDRDRINEIVSAAKGFYIKSGLLFVVLDIVLVVLYPFINSEIADVTFVRTMIVVLSLSGVVDYFLLGKYRVLLVADQKTYIIAIAQAIGTIVTLIVSIVLIEMNSSPILVKAVVVIVYLLRTLYIMLYVKKKYDYICFSKEYSPSAFPQRKSALLHQIVGMVCNNTDVVLLTALLQKDALVEVSVYGVYNMVAYNLTALFNSISKGVGASFGSLMAQDDQCALKKTFSIFELLYFMLLFTVYTCMGVLLYSFISLYSSSFKDSEIYIRWALVALFTACGIVQNIRIPGMTIQVAAGHFKQTQGAAIVEAVINLGVSLALIRPIGINGVLIGTLAAYLYRSTYVIIYNAHHFLPNSLKTSLSRIVRNFMLLGALIAFGVVCIVPLIHSWLLWVAFAAVMVMVSSGLFLLINYLVEPDVVKGCLQYAKGMVKKA